jgi:hypothetical protein
MWRSLGGKPFIVSYIVGVRYLTLIENLDMGFIRTYHHLLGMVVLEVVLKEPLSLVVAVVVAHSKYIKTPVLVENPRYYFMVDQIAAMNHQSYLITVAQSDKEHQPFNVVVGIRNNTDGSVEISIMTFFLYLGVITAQKFFQFGVG